MADEPQPPSDPSEAKPAVEAGSPSGPGGARAPQNREDRDDREDPGQVGAAGVPPGEATAGDLDPAPSVLPATPMTKGRVLAVAGAKGGVGKSIVAANLAIYLASLGRRVILVDADAEGASLHTVLGVSRPDPSSRRAPEWLDQDHRGEGAVPRDDGPSLVETAIPSLSLFHGGIDEPALGSVRRRSRARLFRVIRELPADYLVVDLGTGTQPSLLDAFLDADLGLFVATPEPTAIDSTYRFVRSLFARALKSRVGDAETRRALVQRLRSMGNAPSPLDLARRLEAAGDPLADVVRGAIDDFELHFVLNKARLRADLELGESMSIACRRRHGVSLDYLAYIEEDDAVWACLRQKRPVLTESPGTKASKNIEKVARRLLALESGKRSHRPLRNVPAESHHDLLEVDRGATDEEIRRAYKRVGQIYDRESLACYGLFDGVSREALEARLEEAYDVLLDPARRRPYERSVFPLEPSPDPLPTSVESDEPRPPAPVITPDTEFTGPLLRAVRESQGVTVREIAQRTKIGVPPLEALEAEEFEALPAPVYVRGFVTEVAKFLRLDPEHVSRSYVRRYKRFIDERGKSFS